MSLIRLLTHISSDGMHVNVACNAPIWDKTKIEMVSKYSYALEWR